MKSTLLRLSALLLTFSVGVALPPFFKAHHSIQSSSGVGSVVSPFCRSADEPLKGGHVVVSVPNDSDFYIGKSRVELPEIPDRVKTLLGNLPVESRVVFVKSAAGVRFETVGLINNKLRDADIGCVEFVLDKKKRGSTFK